MPRFFFDLYDGSDYVPDHFGDEFSNLEEARDQAEALVAHLIREKLPNGKNRRFACELKDRSKSVVFLIELEFRCREMN